MQVSCPINFGEITHGEYRTKTEMKPIIDGVVKILQDPFDGKLV